MLFRINVNGNEENISNVPIKDLTDKQFIELQEVINKEARRRVEERLARAEIWTCKLRDLCSEIEADGFTLAYNDEIFDFNDFCVQA